MRKNILLRLDAKNAEVVQFYIQKYQQAALHTNQNGFDFYAQNLKSLQFVLTKNIGDALLEGADHDITDVLFIQETNQFFQQAHNDLILALT